MTVLFLAAAGDLHADCIIQQFHVSDFLRIDPVNCLDNKIYYSSAEMMNSVLIGGKQFNPSTITGIYTRVALESIGDFYKNTNDLEIFSLSEFEASWVSAFSMIPENKWINFPRNEFWADYKPSSLHKAKQLGIDVPNWEITNSIDLLKRTNKKKRRVIKQISDTAIGFQEGKYVSVPDYKPFKTMGTRTFNPEKVNKHIVDDTPFFIQEYIQREKELQITVIDNNVFAMAEISTELVDIKDNKEVKYKFFQLPASFQDKIIDLTSILGLRFCTYDVVLDKAENYFLVDINPAGNWLWLDRLFDMEISKEIIKALLSHN